MKRLTLTITSLLFPVFLLAQEGINLGTKSDLITAEPTTKPPVSSGVSPTQFLPMIVALAIVFVVVKYVLPKYVGKFNKRLSTPFGSPITLEETTSFATGNLQVVTVRGKSLLLAITPQGVSCLAEVPTHAPVDPVPAFFEILDKESEEPKPQRLVTHAVIEEPTNESAVPKAHPATKAYATQTKSNPKQPSREELLARLAQLQKLTAE